MISKIVRGFTKAKKVGLKLDLSHDYPVIQGTGHLTLSKFKDAIIDQHNQYTRAAGLPDLVQSISESYSGVFNREINPLTEVYISPGATSSFTTFVRSYLPREAKVLVVGPCYEAWQNFLTYHGCWVERVEVYSKEELHNKLIKHNHQAVLFTNPGNPSQIPYSTEQIVEIANVLEHSPNTILISDDALNLHCGYNPYSPIASNPQLWKRCVTIFSGDKEFNCEGLRVGWTIADAEFIKILAGFQIWKYFSTSTPAMVYTLS